MRKVLPAVASLIACVLSACGGCQLPAWQPAVDSKNALVKRIDSTRQDPKFSFVVPSGFEPRVAVTRSQKLYVFRGPARTDGTAAAFLLSSVVKGADQKQSLSPDEGLKVILNSIKTGRSHRWQQTAPELGIVHGQKFARCYWSGEEPSTKRLMRGFAYAATVGDYLIAISGQDFEQSAGSTLKLLEAAALSFEVTK